MFKYIMAGIFAEDISVNNLKVSTINGGLTQFSPIMTWTTTGTKVGYYQRIGNFVTGVIELNGTFSNTNQSLRINKPILPISANILNNVEGTVKYYGSFTNGNFIGELLSISSSQWEIRYIRANNNNVFGFSSSVVISNPSNTTSTEINKITISFNYLL